MNIKEIISESKIENGILILPPTQLDRKDYLILKKELEFLGGKWNTGKKGFEFDRDITIEKLLGNTETKKDLQFFETPDDLADYLVELAEVDNYSIPILEPSAGRGSIIKAIQKVCSCSVYYCEISEVNREYLNEFKNIFSIGNDFINDKFEKVDKEILYKRIIANPPFSKNQDIDHIKKMYSLLDEGGIMVSIASKHWGLSQNKKETEFREWLELVGAEILDIDSGEFKESGTMVGGKIIKIKKL